MGGQTFHKFDGLSFVNESPSAVLDGFDNSDPGALNFWIISGPITCLRSSSSPSEQCPKVLFIRSFLKVSSPIAFKQIEFCSDKNVTF